MNRVPRNESPALAEGKLLHLIFEDYFKGTRSMAEAIEYQCGCWLKEPADEHGLLIAQKAVQGIRDREEALVQWKDQYPVEASLEVEEPFEIEHPLDPAITLRGRPDHVIVMQNAIWHRQNRGLAANMNFGVYMELATRHYHEHVYADALIKKYATMMDETGIHYGGTFMNLVRKLKYRTNAGKKNEKVKTLEEMFFQHPMSIDVESALHQHVMHSLLEHAYEMRRVSAEFLTDGTMPPPNEKMNGGFNGSSIDPFFRVLTGKTDPIDDTYFKQREEMYGPIEEPTE
jgi:hypothetical protein